MGWLMAGALGPAFVGLPVGWAASKLTELGRQWSRKLRRNGELVRLVTQAAEETGLSNTETVAVLDLLEDTATWERVRSGTLEDLAVLVAGQLPEREWPKALNIGRTIASAFLQYALKHLDPELFQQAMMARLDRIEARTDSRHDRVLFAMDVASLMALKDAADEARFAILLERLSHLLDRLPPELAGPGQVSLYLERLVQWLDTDPWPLAQRPSGPALVPSQIERKLRITGPQEKKDKDQDADQLSSRCSRLVILGNPGTGKTWFAKRAARRCALAAMSRLAEGASLDEVELPLYATCAKVVSMPQSDSPRRAVVSAALASMPDLGGERTHEAVQALFENREAPTLLILDSLDEAAGPDERIRLADTFPRAWRIILTSRPAAWNRRLAMGTDQSDPLRISGTLQPLQYPQDVDQVIADWFANRPEQGRRLSEQIRNRLDLQQAATVPLILAFYCIVGGEELLPAMRLELYDKVIVTMLTGAWRDSATSPSNVEACMKTLRKWAWSTTQNDDNSGKISTWIDEFITEPPVETSNHFSLDHVAVPQGPPEEETESATRRFAHRSIQEHLVAQYVSKLGLSDATRALFPHLWFDPDWEYAAPAALAAHEQRDDLLRNLIFKVTNSEEFPGNIAAFDSCYEIRRFLARVAQYSLEEDWSRQSASLITQARRDLVEAKSSTDLIFAPGWKFDNPWLFQKISERIDSAWLFSLDRSDIPTLAQIGKELENRGHAQSKIIDLISRHGSQFGGELAIALTGFFLSEAERSSAIRFLLEGIENREAIVFSDIGSGLSSLAQTESDQRAIAGRLVHLVQLARDNYMRVWSISGILRRLKLNSEEKEILRKELICNIKSLTPDRNSGRPPSLSTLTEVEWIAPLASAFAEFDPNGREQKLVLQSLLTVISPNNPMYLTMLTGDFLEKMPSMIKKLAASQMDLDHVRLCLISWIFAATVNDHDGCFRLARIAIDLELDEAQRIEVKDSLLSYIDRRDCNFCRDADLIASLQPEPDELRRLTDKLMTQLERESSPWKSQDLAEAGMTLAVNDLERDAFQTQARKYATEIFQNGSPDINREKGNWQTFKDVVRLSETVEARSFGRAVLFDRLQEDVTGSGATDTQGWNFSQTIEEGALLAVSDSERSEMKIFLLHMLNAINDKSAGKAAINSLARLNPGIDDLADMSQWPHRPTLALLASVRRNSSLNDWLAVLPTIGEMG